MLDSNGVPLGDPEKNFFARDPSRVYTQYPFVTYSLENEFVFTKLKYFLYFYIKTHSMENLPKDKTERVVGRQYMFNDRIVIWNGRSLLCEHKKQRSRCKDCGGSQICEHDRQRITCKQCDPNGYLTSIMRSRVRSALKNYETRRDKQHTMEYIGCSIEDLRTHLENKFSEGMTWENQGEWHIDHIRPCASFDLDIEEERLACFHFTNLQPLWGPDNLSKSDKYDEDEDDREWIDGRWV